MSLGGYLRAHDALSEALLMAQAILRFEIPLIGTRSVSVST
jgi:hypothetical protein